MSAQAVTLQRADVQSDAATRLISALNAELEQRYPEEGANFFSLDPSEVTPGQGAFVVAWADGEAIGCGALRRLDAEVAEIKRMYVASGHRGQGIGRAILANLEAEARALGFLRLVLETGDRQPEALALYRGAGFIEIPCFGEYADAPLSLCMGKELHQSLRSAQAGSAQNPLEASATKVHRIMLIGSGGAGKSTLAQQLGVLLRLPVYHLDALLWQPGWVMTPKDKERAVFEELVQRDEWIIDGNYGAGWSMEARLAAAEMVVFLDLPRSLSLWRAFKRWVVWRGRTRPDMGPGCPERMTYEYLRWIWRYPLDNRLRTLELMAQHAGHQQQFRLRSPKEVVNFLNAVQAPS